jgi:hypothetical protein
MESAAPRRFAGDGFDYRRPAGPAQEQVAEPVHLSAEEDEAEAEGDSDMIDLSRDEDGDVIDLTADDSGYGASHDGNSGGARGNEGASSSEQPNRNRRRLPRGMDIIIDLDNGEEEWRMATPHTEARASPEIEFISSRTIDVPNEVEFVRSNALPVDERRRREHQEMDRVLDRMDMHGLHGHITHLRAHVERFGAHMNRAAADLQRRGPDFPPRRPNRGRVHAGFAMPGPMDFHTVAFDVNFGAPARPAAPPATYTAPPKAPDGFTRSPEEEGPLICPNCEEDLCVGDDEVKRQVWIVKGCGHVGFCHAKYYIILTLLPGLLRRVHSQQVHKAQFKRQGEAPADQALQGVLGGRVRQEGHQPQSHVPDLLVDKLEVTGHSSSVSSDCFFDSNGDRMTRENVSFRQSSDSTISAQQSRNHIHFTFRTVLAFA